MSRSHLDYCSSVWSPYRKGDMEDIEEVQKKTTKLIPESSETHELYRQIEKNVSSRPESNKVLPPHFMIMRY